VSGPVAVTVADDSFLAGAVGSVSTLLEHHPGLEVRVLHHPLRVPLSREARGTLEALGDRVRCVEGGDEQFWACCDDLAERLDTPDRLRSAFLVLWAFSFSDAHKVLAFDSDLIFLAPCPEIFDDAVDFGAVRALDDEGVLPRSFFNSGLLSIGRAHLTGSTLEDLLLYTRVDELGPGVGRADQALLNAYFTPPRVTYLDPGLNVSKRAFSDERGDLDSQMRAARARVIHYVGEKPWQHHSDPREQRYGAVEGLWWDTLDAYAPTLAARWRSRVLERRA
jgi:lipopolysaccharide biosynthesis glycosyltransferase